MDPDTVELIKWTVSVITPAAAGVGGVAAGAWLTTRREIRLYKRDLYIRILRGLVTLHESGMRLREASEARATARRLREQAESIIVGGAIVEDLRRRADEEEARAAGIIGLQEKGFKALRTHIPAAMLALDDATLEKMVNLNADAESMQVSLDRLAEAIRLVKKRARKDVGF